MKTKSKKRPPKGKWETYGASNEEQTKESLYLEKYRELAGASFDEEELIEMFKKYNFEDEQISKEINNRVKMGDDYEWKEIRKGKAVTTRSIDPVFHKKKNYRTDKSVPSYDINEDDFQEAADANRNKKGSYNKYRDFYHYNSKKPKRPFQKCYEVSSDYKFPTSNNEVKDNDKKEENTQEKNNENDKNEKNENVEKENLKDENLTDKKNKEDNVQLEINEKTKEDNNEFNNNDEEENAKNNLISLKENAFNNLKRFKRNKNQNNNSDKDTSNLNNNREKNRYYQQNELNNKKEDSNFPENDTFSQQEFKTYIRNFFGNMKRCSKRIENNIKIANSKDSESSDEKSPEITKIRSKNTNLPNNYYINQKNNIIIQHNGKKITGQYRKNSIQREEKENDLELESKVSDFFISSCYDNPYREQYLKAINEKRKQNPDKVVELVFPQFPPGPLMQPYPNMYQYNPYINPNMYMMPPQYQMQNSMINPGINSQINEQINTEIGKRVNPQLSNQINSSMNSQMNVPINNQINSNMMINMNNIDQQGQNNISKTDNRNQSNNITEQFPYNVNNNQSSSSGNLNIGSNGGEQIEINNSPEL